MQIFQTAVDLLGLYFIIVQVQIRHFFNKKDELI